MYGTVYRIQPKAGKEQDILQMTQEWNRERPPKVKGAVAGAIFKLDNGGVMGVAIFQSEADYRRNA